MQPIVDRIEVYHENTFCSVDELKGSLNSQPSKLTTKAAQGKHRHKMATVSLSSTLYSTYRTKLHTRKEMPSCSLTIPIRTFNFQTKLALKSNKQKWGFNGMRVLRSSEEETLVTEQETEAVEETVAADEQQPVAVPVSSSDKLTMYFQADGTISETAIPAVTQALQGTEGISDLKVQVLEGIATVELKKQTTVQATGVAANLVEIIQGSGFKLQTLNLSFDNEEEVLV